MDRTVTFKQEETSDHEPQPGLFTELDWRVEINHGNFVVEDKLEDCQRGLNV
jgi:hypothetical protein